MEKSEENMVVDIGAQKVMRLKYSKIQNQTCHCHFNTFLYMYTVKNVPCKRL